ncbi:MAG TPA: hypothetical protein PKA64_02850 [Myxococcota bacterium]|nr:hypothetical protein [Myxococcota bacterium]
MTLDLRIAHRLAALLRATGNDVEAGLVEDLAARLDALGFWAGIRNAARRALRRPLLGRRQLPGPAIWELVIADMRERDRIGAERYGDRLRPESPNDALQYAYEEALDLAVYLKQELIRRGGSR